MAQSKKGPVKKGLGGNKNVGGMRGVGGGMSTSRARAGTVKTTSIKKVKSKINNPSKIKKRTSSEKIMRAKAKAYALYDFSPSRNIPIKKDRSYK